MVVGKRQTYSTTQRVVLSVLCYRTQKEAATNDDNYNVSKALSTVIVFGTEHYRYDIHITKASHGPCELSKEINIKVRVIPQTKSLWSEN
jgi:hypothetical protein